MSRLQDLRAALQNSDTTDSTIRRSVYEQVNATPAMQEVKPAEKKQEPVVAPEVTEEPQHINSLLKYYIRVAGSFSRLNGDMLTQNLLVVSSGLPEDVRVISLESFMWLAGHFGELTAAMILNHRDIQQVVVDALSKELDLIKLADADRLAAHDAAGYPYDLEKHYMELGLTEFTSETQLMIVERISQSINALSDTKLSNAVDTVLDSYEQKDADDLGAILSNPIYLLIACNYNAAFMASLSDILADLKSVYEI